MRTFTIVIFFALLGAVSCKKETQNQLTEQLWYKTPSSDWFEALPIGNGRLGAMVFGGLDEEHIQLNEESLWAGCPEDPYPENVEEHYAEFQKLNMQGKFDEALQYGLENLAVSPTSIRPYVPLGDLFLKFDHSGAQNYKRKLDLEKGITDVVYELNGNQYKRESFISTKYDVVLYHFFSMDGEPADCEINFSRKTDIKQYVDDNKILNVDGQLFDDPNGYDDNKGGSGKGGYHMKFSSHVGVQSEDGKISASGFTLKVEDATEFTVIVSAATDYSPELMNFDRGIDSKAKSYLVLENAMQTPYEKIKEDHIRAHSEIYNRVDLQIADIEKDTIPTNERVEALKAGGKDKYLTQLFFQYGRYLLMGSSGGRAALPANLQGIWNDDYWPAWEADFHLNINLQMNYWPADVCNLSETFIPLTDFMVRLAEKGKQTAHNFIGSEGWAAHHVSNPFGRTTPSGSTKESMVNNGYCFPLAGAWMAISLWRHYEFNQDEQYLAEKVYPVIKGASQFILDYLVENEKGELVTVPSYSPENSYIDPVSGKRLRNTIAATVDIQIITDVLQACLKSESILKTNELTKRITVALEKLPKIKIGADGTIQEWYEDYEDAEPGHRHISHLFGLHPSGQISKAFTPELYKAAEKTLEKRLSYGGGQTGWSRAWVVNFYARLLNGDECDKHIEALIKEQVTANLFDLHPPHIFQIDGNFGATAGIAEMLIQSHEENTIRLLPALPSSWSTGHVTGIKARGGYVVDIYWENGTLLNVKVYSEKGGNPKLIYKDKMVQANVKNSITYKAGMADFN